MNPCNNITLVGTLVNDPTFAKTKEGIEFEAKFSLAVKRNYKDRTTGKYERDYFQVSVTGEKRAANIHRFKKGQSVTVVGSLKSGSFITRSGDKRYFTCVSADGVSWNPQSYSDDGKESISSSSSQNISQDEESEGFDIGLPFA